MKETNLHRRSPLTIVDSTQKAKNERSQYFIHKAKKEPKEKLYAWKKRKPWKQANRFIQLPRLIVADKQLSHGAIRLATVISTYDISKKNLPEQAEPVNKSSTKTREKLFDTVNRRALGHGTEGIVYPGNKLLAYAMGISEPMMIQYINELMHAGYIEKRRRWSKSNLLVMKFPVVASIENLVKKYSIFMNLRADDFKGIAHNEFMKEVKRFFEIVKELKDDYREAINDGNADAIKCKYCDLERMALERYYEAVETMKCKKSISE